MTLLANCYRVDDDGGGDDGGGSATLEAVLPVEAHQVPVFIHAQVPGVGHVIYERGYVDYSRGTDGLPETIVYRRKVTP